ncbi:hypothetical protein VNO77_03443 [Canavalia gladiata]|uniref:Uncharacterized protein n=1 Tax=Canavalia gladiata TaxID=3824 RepID=A0AAN9MZV7_CANGL
MLIYFEDKVFNNRNHVIKQGYSSAFLFWMPLDWCISLSREAVTNQSRESDLIYFTVSSGMNIWCRLSAHMHVPHAKTKGLMLLRECKVIEKRDQHRESHTKGRWFLLQGENEQRSIWFHESSCHEGFHCGLSAFSIFFGIQGRFNTLGLSYQDIFGKLCLWKLVMSVLSFSSTSAMMFGLYLLYYFGVFGRQIGSNKYTVFIMFSIITSLLLEVLAVALLKDCTANLVSPRPYGLVFASSVLFFFDIPVSTKGVWHSCRPLVPLECLQYPNNEVPQSFCSWFLLPSMGSPHAASTSNVDHMSIKKTGVVEGVSAWSSLSCRIGTAEEWPPNEHTNEDAVRSECKSVVHQVRKMEKEIGIGGASTRLKPLRRRRDFGTHTNVVTCTCTTLILGR